MAIDNTENLLQAVATLNDAGLGLMSNISPLATLANKEFIDYQKIEGQLGSVVKVLKPPKAVAKPGLVSDLATGIVQDYYTLEIGGYDSTGTPSNNEDLNFYDSTGNICAYNAFFQVTSQQLIQNVPYGDGIASSDKLNYISKVMGATTMEICSSIELSIGNRIAKDTYKFWCAGVDGNNNVMQINNYEQIVNAKVTMQSMGAQSDRFHVVLPVDVIPGMVAQNFTQFVPKRNDEQAIDWKIGEYANIGISISNLLPKHIAGDIANEGIKLTVVSVKKNAEGGITGFVCSGTGTSTSATALVKNDLGYITTKGFNSVTPSGHVDTGNTITFNVTNPGTPASGNIEFDISHVLYFDPNTSGGRMNITKEIVAGVTMKFVPNHKVGLLMNNLMGKANVSGSTPLYLAMPKMPPQEPYYSGVKTDPITKLSLKSYYGSPFGKEKRGFIQNAIWGSMLASDNVMRLIFPDTSSSNPIQSYVTDNLPALFNVPSDITNLAISQLSKKK